MPVVKVIRNSRLKPGIANPGGDNRSIYSRCPCRATARRMGARAAGEEEDHARPAAGEEGKRTGICPSSSGAPARRAARRPCPPRRTGTSAPPRAPRPPPPSPPPPAPGAASSMMIPPPPPRSLSLSLSSTCAHTRPGSGTANLSRETWERRAAGGSLRTKSLTTEPASLPRPYLYCIRADAARAHPYRTGGAGATSIASGRRTRPPCPEDPRAWCATACATRPRTGPGGR